MANNNQANSGYWNFGSFNTGNWNAGNRNTGNWNTGSWNTGNWNTGNCNIGSFNTITPEDGYFFDKRLSFEEWEKAIKPDWLYMPSPATWIAEDEMTEQEKADNPSYETTGGYLRKNDMRKEWRAAYESATAEEVQMVRDLPNFDPEVFEEITGLDLCVKPDSCDGKVVEIDGKKYKLTEV